MYFRDLNTISYFCNIFQLQFFLSTVRCENEQFRDSSITSLNDRSGLDSKLYPNHNNNNNIGVH